MLEVLTYPDKRLKQHSKLVENFDEKLHQIIDNMIVAMRAKEGIGLAAIQVGIPKRLLVIELLDEESKPCDKVLEVINPEIIAHSGEQKYNEGCLSLPSYYEEVIRAASVSVKYQNRFGEILEISADGLLAVALQHEIDHLNGKLFFERLSILKRKKFEKEYAELRNDGKTKRRNP
jgi:peptide deformylase